MVRKVLAAGAMAATLVFGPVAPALAHTATIPSQQEDDSVRVGVDLDDLDVSTDEQASQSERQQDDVVIEVNTDDAFDESGSEDDDGLLGILDLNSDDESGDDDGVLSILELDSDDESGNDEGVLDFDSEDDDGLLGLGIL